MSVYYMFGKYRCVPPCPSRKDQAVHNRCSLYYYCILNDLGQVGIVAVNIIGEKLAPGVLDAPQMRHGSGPRDHASYSPPMEDERRGKRAQRSSFAGMNDLSFDVNFDPDIAQRIRDVATAKERAVRAEVGD